MAPDNYTIYMRLLRDIGTTRAGSYAFVSPVIAALLGIVSFGEQVRLPDIIGMGNMLAAAGLAMFEGKQKVIASTVGSS